NPNKLLPIINKILNKPRMIGCTTTGIILSESIETRGIAILTIRSDEMKCGIGSVNNINALDVRQAGSILAKNSIADFGQHGRQVFLFFADGLISNNSLLLKGIQEVFGNVFPIVGAGTSDDFHFQETHQLFQNRILTNSATGIILGGHISVGVGGRHGWRPLGKPRIIDSVEGTTIRTINQQRAAGLYEEYFGEETEKLRSDRLGQMAILYPLGIYVEGSREYLLRNAVDIRKDGSIVCQGEVPEGSEVHIMIGNKDSCKQAAWEAALEAKKNLLGKEASLIIVIESMARLKLLGRMAFEEIEKIQYVFGKNVPIIGMYANGEICPFQSVERIKKPHLQNESIVVLAIS
ncbi:MAG: FIST N-terminal domain-containing protein, partial [Candidatus Omnitrophota bacterium]|nr:FIST N-terminal domain-containing protein [Candidatus Omnitrophota bacterium]